MLGKECLNVANVEAVAKGNVNMESRPEIIKYACPVTIPHTLITLEI